MSLLIRRRFIFLCDRPFHGYSRPPLPPFHVSPRQRSPHNQLSRPDPFSSSAMGHPNPSDTNEPDLYTLLVQFQTEQGHHVQLNAIYQDTHPSSSSSSTTNSSATEPPPTRRRPVVVFVHGSPGSHKDFKYMIPPLRQHGLRSIALNWPGMGYTSFDSRLRLTNPERTAFAKSLIDQLLPDPSVPLIFVGHSRGGENALRLAHTFAARTQSLLLLNSCGFRPHRVVRPQWMIRMASRIWTWDERLQKWLAPIFHKIHGLAGLKTENGFIAGRSVMCHCTYDFDKLKPLLGDLLRKPTRLKIVFVYSGNDPLIEKEISEEFARELGGQTLISMTNPKEEDAELSKKFGELIKGMESGMSIFFAKEGHFLQKHQAQTMANFVIDLA